MAQALPRRSRRDNRRGSLRPCRNPTPAPHAGQTLTAPCFRLLSRPTENCFVCFRTGAVRQQKKWGPQRDPRKFRAGIGGKLSSSDAPQRSEEHTSELQSLMRISYAVFCLKKTNTHQL